MPTKDIHDSIHKTITIPDIVMDFIDTPEFQRLRRVKQLGAAVFVYPTATHSRFEHSIGCGHLARKLMTCIRDNQRELDISNRDIDIIQLAGTLHDIGHGPFSHVFERVKPDFCHENMSCDIIDHINNRLKKLTDGVLTSVKDLIRGKSKTLPKWKLQIIANHYNYIDVDKLDYIVRDSRMVGFCDNIDYDRIFKNTRVIDNELCFNTRIYDCLLYTSPSPRD